MVIVSKVRACLTVDGRLVRDTHAEAAFLLVAEGSEIDEIELADRGFTPEQLAALEAEDAEPQVPQGRGFPDTVPDPETEKPDPETEKPEAEEEESAPRPTGKKSAAKPPAEPAEGTEGA